MDAGADGHDDDDDGGGGGVVWIGGRGRGAHLTLSVSLPAASTRLSTQIHRCHPLPMSLQGRRVKLKHSSLVKHRSLREVLALKTPSESGFDFGQPSQNRPGMIWYQSVLDKVCLNL